MVPMAIGQRAPGIWNILDASGSGSLGPAGLVAVVLVLESSPASSDALGQRELERSCRSIDHRSTEEKERKASERVNDALSVQRAKGGPAETLELREVTLCGQS